MRLVRVNFDKARDFTTVKDYEAAKEEILKAKATLLTKRGAGSEYTGWVDLPVEYDRNEFEAIKKSGGKNQGRFRSAGRDRHRRILSWRESCL